MDTLLIAKQNIFLLITVPYLLTAAAGTVAVTNATSHGAVTQQDVVMSTCAATLYPELCVSAIADAAVAVASSKDVLVTALNHTIYTVESNYFTIKKIAVDRRNSLTAREKTALHDCLELIDDTLEELLGCNGELGDFGFKNYSLVQHKDKLVTLLSAAQTNQETCLDGFSHDEADKKIRQVLIAGQMHIFRLVSNVMAIIKKLSDIEMAENVSEVREGSSDDWPEWLSVGDRKLLQSSTVVPDVTVAADGSGNYSTVSAAVAAAPTGSSRYVIRIRAGVYRENVEIPRAKTNLMFVGDGRTTTIITGSRNVIDGGTTFNSATVGRDTSRSIRHKQFERNMAFISGNDKQRSLDVFFDIEHHNQTAQPTLKTRPTSLSISESFKARRKSCVITLSRILKVIDNGRKVISSGAVVGSGFLARDITFENTAGPSKHQAVALRVNADLTAFYRCDMLAYQDTLYVHSLRQFYTGCYIAGTVDFIFGNAAAVLQDCDIHARRPDSGQRNMVTAQGRNDPNQNTGIVIQRCSIGATSDLLPVIGSFPTYLGRPWQEYSRTVVMQTQISNVIRPEGWYEWNGNFALDTLFYAEYMNTGAGANTSNRVTWSGFGVLTTAEQARPFTAENFISSSSWLPTTGFPFNSGL